MTTVYVVKRPDDHTLLIRATPIAALIALVLLFLFTLVVLFLTRGGGAFAGAIRLWSILALVLGGGVLFGRARRRIDFRFDRDRAAVLHNGEELARFGDITAVEMRVYEGDVHRLLALRLRDGRRVQLFYGPEQQVMDAAATVGEWVGAEVSRV